MATENLTPNAEGTYAGHATFPAAAPLWDKWDDPPGIPDEDATYLTNPTGGPADTSSNIVTPVLIQPGDTIHTIAVLIRSKNNDPQFLANVTTMLVIGGVRYLNPAVHPLSPVYTNYMAVGWLINPATLLPWALADLTNLEIGARGVLDRNTQIYAVVTYTPAGAGAASVQDDVVAGVIQDDVIAGVIQDDVS